MSEWNGGGGGGRRGAPGQGPLASSPKVGRAARGSLPHPDCVDRLPEGAQVRRVDWTKLPPPSLGVEIQAIRQVGLTPPEHPNPPPAATLTQPSRPTPVPPGPSQSLTSSLTQSLVWSPNPSRVLPPLTPQPNLTPPPFHLPSSRLSPSPSHP